MRISRPKRDGSFLKIFEFILYVIIVVGGLYLSYFIRFGSHPPLINLIPFYQNIPYIVLTSAVVFYIFNITSTAKKSLYENVIIIVASLFLIDTLTLAIMFFSRGFSFPRSIFIIGFITQCVFILITKILILSIIKRTKKQQKILIIAPTENSNLLADGFTRDTGEDCIEYVLDSVDKNTYHLIDYVDKVYVDTNIPYSDKLDLIKYCSVKDKVIYIVPGLLEIAMMNSKIKNKGDVLLLKVEPLGLSFEQRVMKRTMDVVLSAIGLVLTSPLFLIIALMIKLEDRGPVFYKQKRVTENNRIFEIYKFRTMVVDAEKYTGPVLAMENDPRILKVGRFLRATRLDELPQLINVLKGEMSIVGPRPERPHFVKQFNEEIEEFKYRVFVKAGITGLAQILGRYTTKPENKAKYDLLYIRNYSLLLDIRIMINTLKILFCKDKSAGVRDEDKEIKLPGVGS